jgi:hypothetical protein
MLAGGILACAIFAPESNNKTAISSLSPTGRKNRLMKKEEGVK